MVVVVGGGVFSLVMVLTLILEKSERERKRNGSWSYCTDFNCGVLGRLLQCTQEAVYIHMFVLFGSRMSRQDASGGETHYDRVNWLGAFVVFAIFAVFVWVCLLSVSYPRVSARSLGSPAV